MAAVTICSDFGAWEKVCHCFHCFPSICHEMMGPDSMILVFWMLSFKPAFPLSSFTFIKRLLSSSLLSAIRVVSSAYLRLLVFLPAILIPACSVHDLVISGKYPAAAAAFNYHSPHCFLTPPSRTVLSCHPKHPLVTTSDSPSSFWMFPGHQIASCC